MTLQIACVYSVEDYINPQKPITTGYSIPFGIAMIASILKSAGYTIKTLVITPDTPLLETLRSFIEDCQPKLFCLTAVSTQFPLMSQVAKVIKTIDPKIFIALGGHHASLAPEKAISCPHIDAICIGEGENAVIEMAAQLEAGLQPSGIDNFWFKEPNSGMVEKNPTAPFIDNLDPLPFIDRDLWRPWINEPDLEPAVLVGRGCPNRCSYCSNHALRKLARGRYVRFRSPNNIVAEIEQIAQNFSVSAIYLEVETIGANLAYALELCEVLAEFNRGRSNPIQFKINLSVTSKLTQDINLLDQLFSAFQRAGFVTLNIGLESGSERIRNGVLRRPPYTNEEIILFCNVARKYQIKIDLYVMIGIPGETLADFKKTIEVVRCCESNRNNLSIFYPYPGTDIYQIAKEKGYFSEQEIGHEKDRRRVYVKLPYFSQKRIMWEYIMFNYNVHKGKLPLQQIMIYTIETLLLASPNLKRLYRYITRNTKIGNALLQIWRHKWKREHGQF